jgi:hypothetical protein
MLSFTTLGCSGAPTEALQEVHSALGRAHTADAERYAPEALFEAEAALDAARLEIDAQAERFALARSYEDANRLLDEARSLAESAEATALAEREHARQAASEAIAEAEDAMSRAQLAIEKAPGGKGTRADVAAMMTEIEDARSSLEEAIEAFDRGDYLSARAHAEAIRARSMSIVAEIDVARKKAT